MAEGRQDPLIEGINTLYAHGFYAYKHGPQIRIWIQSSVLSLLSGTHPSIYVDSHEDGYSIGELKFRTYKAVIMYLFNPVARLSTRVLNVFLNHPKRLGHASLLIDDYIIDGVAYKNMMIERITFMNLITVDIYDDPRWHNCCAIRYETEIIYVDWVITEKELDQYIHNFWRIKMQTK